MEALTPRHVGSETFRGTEIRRPSVETHSHQTSEKAPAWRISFQLEHERVSSREGKNGGCAD